MSNKFTQKKQILTEKEQINQLSPLQRATLALNKLDTKLNTWSQLAFSTQRQIEMNTKAIFWKLIPIHFKDVTNSFPL